MTQSVRFAKYHGAGNDFILIDNRETGLRLLPETIAGWCHRRFGIGADGLMLLEDSTVADFRLVYYNADGSGSTLCGNGSRCMVAFAQHCGAFTGSQVRFEASDGIHAAGVLPDGRVMLEMHPVTAVSGRQGGVFLDTGSPHLVLFTGDVSGSNVQEEGRALRSHPDFAPGGTNVNFVERLSGNRLKVRTYERGVEAETLSCGTGVTAAAIAATGQETGLFDIAVETPGGTLQVAYQRDASGTVSAIVLTGPAAFVYSGEIHPDA